MKSQAAASHSHTTALNLNAPTEAKVEGVGSNLLSPKLVPADEIIKEINRRNTPQNNMGVKLETHNKLGIL